MIVGENLDSARLASFQVDCGDEVKHMVSTRGSFIVQVRTATSASGGRGAKAWHSTSPPLRPLRRRSSGGGCAVQDILPPSSRQVLLVLSPEEGKSGGSYSLSVVSEPIAAGSAEASHYPPCEMPSMHVPVSTGIAQSLDAVLAQFLGSMHWQR